MRPDQQKADMKNMITALTPFQLVQDGGRLGDFDDVSTMTCIDHEALRCCGIYNESKSLAHPRMHNKYLVFLRKDPLFDDSVHTPYPINYIPYAVWTGSLNFTFNSENSLENGLYIECPTVAMKYFNDFCRIFTASEPLDWKHKYCRPDDFRVGT